MILNIYELVDNSKICDLLHFVSVFFTTYQIKRLPL